MIIIDRKFNYLFGMSVCLDKVSNNYAEYSGMIYALVFSNLLELKSVNVYSDSELLVT